MNPSTRKNLKTVAEGLRELLAQVQESNIGFQEELTDLGRRHARACAQIERLKYELGQKNTLLSRRANCTIMRRSDGYWLEVQAGGTYALYSLDSENPAVRSVLEAVAIDGAQMSERDEPRTRAEKKT